jgi:hypothetical protein
MSYAVDGTDMLWNGTEEDENVSSDYKEDEGTDWEDIVTLIGKGR